jgi:hypothetical protein
MVQNLVHNFSKIIWFNFFVHHFSKKIWRITFLKSFDLNFFVLTFFKKLFQHFHNIFLFFCDFSFSFFALALCACIDCSGGAVGDHHPTWGPGEVGRWIDHSDGSSRALVNLICPAWHSRASPKVLQLAAHKSVTLVRIIGIAVNPSQDMLIQSSSNFSIGVLLDPVSLVTLRSSAPHPSHVYNH